MCSIRIQPHDLLIQSPSGLLLKEKKIHYLPVLAKLYPVCNSLYRWTECLWTELIQFRKGQLYYTFQSSNSFLFFFFLNQIIQFIQLISSSFLLLSQQKKKKKKDQILILQIILDFKIESLVIKRDFWMSIILLFLPHFISVCDLSYDILIDDLQIKKKVAYCFIL